MNSVGWTMGERLFSLGATYAVSIMVANYLGVDNFGQLLFAIALVTLFSTLVGGGLQGVVVRDLVRCPAERAEILGTVLLVRTAAGLACFAIVVALVILIHLGEATDVTLTIVVALSLCFRAGDVVDLWFQSQTQMRYVSYANLVQMVVGNAVRLTLVAIAAPLIWFGVALVVGTAIRSFSLVYLYRRNTGSLRDWSPHLARAGRYAREGLPLMLSGVASSLNLKVDQLLLGVILGSAAVGTYGVAARLSEVWYFIPTTVAAAVFPAIIRAKEAGPEHYRRRLRQIYAAFIWGAIAVAIAVSLVASPVISLLYSSEYTGATAVLVVHVWTAPFLFMGVVLSKWLIIENMLWTSLVRHGFGAGLNIGLNLVLIPAHGPVGAAVATLISYAAANFGACLLSARTRPAALDMTMGFLLPFRMGGAVLSRLHHRRKAPSVEQ